MELHAPILLRHMGFCNQRELGFAHEDQIGGLCASVFEHDAHQCVDQIFQQDLAGDGLRSLGDRQQIHLRQGCGEGCLWLRLQLQMASFELPDLAVGAPARITISRLPQIQVGACSDASLSVKRRGAFISDGLVLDKAVRMGATNCFLIKSHRRLAVAVQAGDLCRHQRVLVAEGRRIVFGPLAQLRLQRRQAFAPCALLFGANRLITRRPCERSVVDVVQHLGIVAKCRH